MVYLQRAGTSENNFPFSVYCCLTVKALFVPSCFFFFFLTTHSGYSLRHLQGESTARSWQPCKESFCVAHKRKTANELGRRRLRWFMCLAATPGSCCQSCPHPQAALVQAQLRRPCASLVLATAYCRLALTTLAVRATELLWGYSWQRLLCMPGKYYIHTYTIHILGYVRYNAPHVKPIFCGEPPKRSLFKVIQSSTRFLFRFVFFLFFVAFSFFKSTVDSQQKTINPLKLNSAQQQSN